MYFNCAPATLSETGIVFSHIRVCLSVQQLKKTTPTEIMGRSWLYELWNIKKYENAQTEQQKRVYRLEHVVTENLLSTFRH